MGDGPRTDDELEERLSRPTPGLAAALRGVDGDVLVLGAGGKMGPSLARMARRALDEAPNGVPNDVPNEPPNASRPARRVVAVSRFGDPAARRRLEGWGVETVAADLADRDAVARLPDAPNVVYMAGQKFGTAGAPARTWGANAYVPAVVGERYAGARVVAFSTGNVYPNTPAPGRGAAEDHALTPLGEYANSCVARERVLEFLGERLGTRLAIVRLSYAVDLRYGVLVDVALRVWRGEPVDVRTGYVNVIWQGDANAQALRCLVHAATPPFVVNVTGPEALAVADLARHFGRAFGRDPRLVGTPAPDALLSDTTRARRLFGPPTVPTASLVDWVAAWVAGGGATLGKPTKFEARDGSY